MSRVCALMELTERDWLRERIADMTLRYLWEDCELSVTTDPDEWSRWIEVFPDTTVIICDIAVEGTAARLRRARSRHPEAVIIPIAEPSISPSVYVHPDILPFALLWRPLADPENEYALFRALSHTHSAAEGPSEACFIIKNRTESWRIPYSEIYYFEARDKKIFLRTAEQELPFYETMSRLEKSLPDYFLRCHKGYLVNQKHIERVDWTNRIIQIRQKICVPLSRSYRNGIKEKMSGTF